MTMLFALPNTAIEQQPSDCASSNSAWHSLYHSRQRRHAYSSRHASTQCAVRIAHRPEPTQCDLGPVGYSFVAAEAPNQIGVNRSVEVSPKTRAQKFVNRDGSEIIVLIIKSSGASGIGVHFRNFALTGGEEVYVYGTTADSIIFGPFTDKGPWGSRDFWSGTVLGIRSLSSSIRELTKTEKDSRFSRYLTFLPKLDLRLRSDEPDVLNCELDASCYGETQKNAVGRITIQR